MVELNWNTLCRLEKGKAALIQSLCKHPLGVIRVEPRLATSHVTHTSSSVRFRSLKPFPSTSGGTSEASQGIPVVALDRNVEETLCMYDTLPI